MVPVEEKADDKVESAAEESRSSLRFFLVPAGLGSTLMRRALISSSELPCIEI